MNEIDLRKHVWSMIFDLKLQGCSDDDIMEAVEEAIDFHKDCMISFHDTQEQQEKQS